MAELDRGWLYSRKTPRTQRGWLGLGAAFGPDARRSVERQEAVRLEEGEDGDPARPRVTIERERGV